MACGFALAMGLVIILVLLAMPVQYPPISQLTDPYIILIFSSLVIFPLIFRRLNRLESPEKILGWTFLGLGAQLIILPLPLVFIILQNPSDAGLFMGGIIFTCSVVFGFPAGLLSITAGAFILRRS